jgi:hypothetical protein
MTAAYSKAIAAALGAVSVWGITAAADGHISGVEWFGLLGALAAVLLVWRSPANTPKE